MRSSCRSASRPATAFRTDHSCGRVVDDDTARGDASRDAIREFGVSGPDRRREAVDRVVRETDRLTPTRTS